MTKENEFRFYSTLHGVSLDSRSIGPTFPPTPTFTMPTGDTGPTPFSAFRATKSTLQAIDGLNNKIKFNQIEYDLNSEYIGGTTSTFTATPDGVYIFISNISFFADGLLESTVAVFFVLNSNINNPIAFQQNHLTDGTIYNIVTVSTMVRLKAGDTIEVCANTNTPGLLFGAIDPSFYGHFEGTRLPSPEPNTL